MTTKTEIKTPAAIVKQIERDLGSPYFSSTSPVAAARGAKLKRILEYLSKDGFPVSDTARIELSLVPYVFQEANYDDISWTDQRSDLGHLAKILEVDFLVQSGGKARLDAGEEEFRRYVELSFQAIKKAQKGDC